MKLEKAVPEKYRLHAHHWLILHGRYTCVARKPFVPDLRGARSVPFQGQDERVRSGSPSERNAPVDHFERRRR